MTLGGPCFGQGNRLLAQVSLTQQGYLTRNISSSSTPPSLDNSSASANNSFEARTLAHYTDPSSAPDHTFIDLIAAMGSVVLPHLVTGWHVDQAIMSEDERLVIIRFGRDWDPDCMRQDEVLYRKKSLLLFTPHLLILHIYRHRRSSQEFCCHLCVRSRPGPRLQANVRWVASLLLDCFYIRCLGVFFSRAALISLF